MCASAAISLRRILRKGREPNSLDAMAKTRCRFCASARCMFAMEAGVSYTATAKTDQSEMAHPKAAAPTSQKPISRHAVLPLDATGDPANHPMRPSILIGFFTHVVRPDVSRRLAALALVA